MAFKKPSMKKLIPIFIALVFLGSVLAVFGQSSRASSTAEITVDLGAYASQPYTSELPINENETALQLLSTYTGNLELDNGYLACVSEYCNTNNTQWKVYTLENGLEVPINQTLENYQVSPEEHLVFRYESTN